MSLDFSKARIAIVGDVPPKAGRSMSRKSRKKARQERELNTLLYRESPKARPDAPPACEGVGPDLDCKRLYCPKARGRLSYCPWRETP